ncbi:hypothetical protein PVAP13_4KG224005 [Panicum virgatum]|uniref:Fucosyltransferase n=1 Tax=Panicum virgatum TaxID=38727 RepID=A0A8T0TGC3_PANVG|nr:hypothetical protein PVAP13_4KG224005 [Panicum virgatum]
MEAKKVAEELADAKRGSWPAVIGVLAVVVLAVLVLSGRNAGAPVAWVQTAAASFRQGSNDLPFLHPRAARYDRLYGGLLVDGFDEESCHSRYQSATYRRNPGRRPSPYLISKLRRHEALQRRCGPGTAAYSAALEQLRSGRSAASPPECAYVVSISYRGIGNRILAAASAFLYAVLTGRALLVDPGNEMDDLFCEPFPNTTWLLPPAGFPLPDYANFSVATAASYGNMVRNKVVVRSDGDAPTAAAQPLPAFAYVHLNYDATVEDNSFFCGGDQRLLRRIQWLVMRTPLCSRSAMPCSTTSAATCSTPTTTSGASSRATTTPTSRRRGGGSASRCASSAGCRTRRSSWSRSPRARAGRACSPPCSPPASRSRRRREPGRPRPSSSPPSSPGTMRSSRACTGSTRRPPAARW